MLLLLPLLVASVADAKPKAKPKLKETPHYDVVAEYIRSLGEIHAIQQSAGKDIDNSDDSTRLFMDMIRNGTRFKFELRVSIGTLKKMNLKEPFETLLPMTVELYKQKLELFDEMTEISKQLVSPTPKEGVDYDKMAGRMPEIRATVEYIDESIFKLMPLVFALLIDQKPDSEGHMSHLSITSAQRQTLIDKIDRSFGEHLEKKNQNWIVGSASMLKAYLQKDYKCTDEWAQ